MYTQNRGCFVCEKMCVIYIIQLFTKNNKKHSAIFQILNRYILRLIIILCARDIYYRFANVIYVEDIYQEKERERECAREQESCHDLTFHSVLFKNHTMVPNDVNRNSEHIHETFWNKTLPSYIHNTNIKLRSHSVKSKN